MILSRTLCMLAAAAASMFVMATISFMGGIDINI